MASLENPFSGKNKSMREIAEDKNTQSRLLLLGICRTAKRTLLSLQSTVPGTAMPALWQGKLDAARREYIAFAEQLGITRDDAEADLARELGEAEPTGRTASPSAQQRSERTTPPE